MSFFHVFCRCMNTIMKYHPKMHSPKIGVQGVALAKGAEVVGRHALDGVVNAGQHVVNEVGEAVKEVVQQGMPGVVEDIADMGAGVAAMAGNAATGAGELAAGVAAMTGGAATEAGELAAVVAAMTGSAATEAEELAAGVAAMAGNTVNANEHINTAFAAVKTLIAAPSVNTAFTALQSVKNAFATGVSFSVSKFNDVHWFAKLFVAGGAVVKYVVGYTLGDLKVILQDLHSWVAGDTIGSLDDTKKKVSNSNTNNKKEVQSDNKSQECIKIKNFIQATKDDFKEKLKNTNDLIEKGNDNLPAVTSMISELVQEEEFIRSLETTPTYKECSNEVLETVGNQDHEVEFTGNTASE